MNRHLFPVTFDMDGVIADTREAVREAYRQVGVEMPDEAWGRPAHEWVSERQHLLKQQIYPQVLTAVGVRRLAGAQVISWLQRDGYRVAVVTNAAYQSATAVLSRAEVTPDALICGDKTETLNHLTPLVHVDDQDVAYPRTLLYSCQGVSWLHDEVMRRVKGDDY